MHSFYSPSSSYRWLKCVGSLHLMKGYYYDEKPSAAAEYGTQLHKLAGVFMGQPASLKRELADLYQDTNGYSPDQVEEAITYSDYVDALHSTTSEAHIEKTVFMQTLHADMYGTPDAIVYDRWSQHLHVVDLKTGREEVSAKGNPQLMLYAIGAISSYQFTPQDITLHIYQNNKRSGDRTNSWQIKPKTLDDFAVFVGKQLHTLHQGTFTYLAGEHCKYCPAKPRCQTYAKEQTTSLQLLTAAKTKPIADLTVLEVAELYAQYKELTPFAELLRVRLMQAPSLADTGIELKRRKVPQTYSDQRRALEILRDAGVDLDAVAPRTLLSPAKLRGLDARYFDLVQEQIDTPEDIVYLALKSKKM